jgi:hypothetical protein
MPKALENPEIPLYVRRVLADAALEYANALVKSENVERAFRALNLAADDAITCLRASYLGMK